LASALPPALRLLRLCRAAQATLPSTTFSASTCPYRISPLLLNQKSDTAEQYRTNSSSQDTSRAPKHLESDQGAHYRTSGDRHLSLLLDSDGIIDPAENAIKVVSNANYAPIRVQHQLRVILDTGFSLPQFPELVALPLFPLFSFDDECVTCNRCIVVMI
jgi:hypothetical protein